MELLLLTFLLLLLWILAYQKCIAPFKYWRNRSVKFDEPSFFYGSLKEYILQKTALTNYLLRLSLKYSDEPYFGIWTFTKPVLVLNNLQLIKEVGIQHIEKFDSHHMFSSGAEDDAFTKNLFVLPGKVWRKVRPTISPVFTRSKLKVMYQLVNDCAKNVTKYYSTNSNGVVSVDVKEDIFHRYTTDVVSTCVFGLELNSFKDKHNEFFERSLDTSDFSGSKIYSLFGHCFHKLIVKWFKMSIVKADNQAFFENVALKAIELRKHSGIKRPDMIQILMEARKDNQNDETITLNHVLGQEEGTGRPTKEQIEMTDSDIVGHFLVFLIAGTEPSAMTLTFIAYELAVNSKIQDRLLQEINEYLKRGNGSINFEDLSQMTYLDMVVSESLRMYPSLPCTDRVANKPHLLKSGGKSIVLEKNTAVWIPIFAIHRDPQYFINPDKFDPERFSKKNRSKMNKDAYMPFGIGPRSCIGSRFALFIIKALLVNLLPKFEFVPVESTPIPLELKRYDFFLNIQDGLNLGVKTREKKI